MVGSGERSARHPVEGLIGVGVTVGRAVLDEDGPGKGARGQRALLGVRGVSGKRDRVVDLPGQRRKGRVDERRRGRIAGVHGQRTGDVRGAVIVGHLQAHGVGSRVGVVEAGVGESRVVELTVAVQVPRVRDRVSRLGRGRAGAREVDQQGCSARERRSRGHGHRSVLDPDDPASVEVGVVQVPIRTDRQVDRTLSRRSKCGPVSRFRIARCSGEHHPDALARVVREKERVVVRGRVVASALIKGHAGHRRTAGRAAVAGHHGLAVAVGEERRGRLSDRRRTDVQARVLRPVSLVARPPVVARRREIGEAVDLLPGVPAHVGDPGLVGAGLDDHPEGIPETESDDPLLVEVAARYERIAGRRQAGGRIDAQDGSIEDARLAGCSPRALAAESAALGRRLGLRGSQRKRRVAARVRGRRAARTAAELAPVGRVEARAVAPGHVQVSVRAEGESSGRVAGILLAPVLDEDLLARGPGRSGGRQARKVSADHAAVPGGPGRRRAAVGCGAGRSPEGGHVADVGIVRIQHVDVVVRLEIGVDGEAEQSPVPEVVDLRSQVDHRRRGVGRDVREHLDEPGLLGNENAAVGQEPDDGGVGQAAEDDDFVKRGLLVDRGRGGAGGHGERDTCQGAGLRRSPNEWENPRQSLPPLSASPTGNHLMKMKGQYRPA